MSQPALRLAWPLPLEALVLGAAARVGLGRHDLTPLAPWIARAASAGSTPARGPFAHELRLPNRERPQTLSLGVFADVNRSGRALTPLLAFAERWATHMLGASAAAVVASLPARARGVGWHGGVRFAGASWSLELSGTGSAPDLAAAARSLGADLAHLELEAGLVALGLEVGGGGIERVRTFERVELAADTPPSASHRLLGRLGGGRGTRTLVTRFKPGVTASALGAHEVDADWLRAMITSIGEAGFALHAASHEIHLHDDGTRVTHVAVAVGEGG
jgi:hypothetical protein